MVSHGIFCNKMFFHLFFLEIHKDMSGYLFLFSHSLVQYVYLDILISYLKRKRLTYETNKDLSSTLSVCRDDKKTLVPEN